MPTQAPSSPNSNTLPDSVRRFREDTAYQAQVLKKLRERLSDDPETTFRRLLKIRTTSGELVEFQINDQQRVIVNLYRALRRLSLPVRLIILKARQVGTSTLGAALTFHATMFTPHQKAKIMADTRDHTENLFNMSKRFYNHLDTDWKIPTQNESGKKIVYAAPHDSEISLDTAGQTTSGRSDTTQIAHLSEVAFWPHAADVATAFLPSVHDLPGTMVLMESTANGIGDYFHDMYWEAKKGKEALVKDIMKNWRSVDRLVEILEDYGTSRLFGEYIPLFFAWYDFPSYRDTLTPSEAKLLKKDLSKEELQMMVDYPITLGNIKFRRRKIKSYVQKDGLTPEDRFRQEYPADDSEAFIVKGSSVFSQDALRRMKTQPPKFTGRMIQAQRFEYSAWKKKNLNENTGRLDFEKMAHHDPYGELKIWEYPVAGEQYAAGGDVALGERGADFSCLQIINKRTLEQVAEWHGKIDADVFARFCVQLGAYYNDADLAIENNSMGLAAIIALRETYYPNPYVKNSQNYRVVHDAPTDEWGWTTNVLTKPMVVAKMAEYIRELLLRINSEQLREECRQYRQDGMKYSAPEGKHDDRVMAMAIALQVQYEQPYNPGVETRHAESIATEKELVRMSEIIDDDTGANLADDDYYGDL